MERGVEKINEKRRAEWAGGAFVAYLRTAEWNSFQKALEAKTTNERKAIGNKATFPPTATWMNKRNEMTEVSNLRGQWGQYWLGLTELMQLSVFLSIWITLFYQLGKYPLAPHPLNKSVARNWLPCRVPRHPLEKGDVCQTRYIYTGVRGWT